MTDQPTAPNPQGPEATSGVPGPDLAPAGLPSQVPPGGVVANGPVGKVRGTGTCILLTIVTLGIYHFVWYYKTSAEMKRHTGHGLGGGIALVLAIFVGIVMPFLSSNEVGHLYDRGGRKAPVSAATGLWFLLLGWFFFVGIIVWFVKTNGALNDYWTSLETR